MQFEHLIVYMFSVFQYFAFNPIAAASDLTFTFEWIDGNFNFTDPVLVITDL